MKHQVFEPVQVVVHFDTLKLNILKFKRGNTVYKVSEVISKWKSHSGEAQITYYTVKCGEQNIVCELSLNHKDLKWEFIQYDNLS